MFVVKLLLWVDLKEEPVHPCCAVSLSNTLMFMLMKVLPFFHSPLKPNYKLFIIVFLISGGSTGDTLSVSLYVSLVVSLAALMALVVLLVNCVTCCKEREINFKVRVLASR